MKKILLILCLLLAAFGFSQTNPPQNFNTPVKFNVVGQDVNTTKVLTINPQNLLSWTNFNSLQGSQNQLISVGSIVEIDDNEYRFNNVVGKINGVQYTVVTQDLFFNSATAGMYRTDIVVLNASGVLQIVQGIEQAEAGAQPVTPANTVLVAPVNIFGDTVFPPVPSFDDFLRKSREQQLAFGQVGTAPNYTWVNKNTYRWLGSSTNLTLHSMSDLLNPTEMYDGRNLTIIHGGTGAILTIVHDSSEPTADIKFYTPTFENITLTRGQSAVFKYSSLTNRLELITRNSSNSFIQSGTFKLMIKGYQGVLKNESDNIQKNDICIAFINTNSSLIPNAGTFGFFQYVSGPDQDPTSYIEISTTIVSIL